MWWAFSTSNYLRQSFRQCKKASWHILCLQGTPAQYPRLTVGGTCKVTEVTKDLLLKYTNMQCLQHSMSDPPVTLDSVSWGRVPEFFVSCGMSFQNNMNSNMKLKRCTKHEEVTAQTKWSIRTEEGLQLELQHLLCQDLEPCSYKMEMSSSTKCTLYINENLTFSKSLHIL